MAIHPPRVYGDVIVAVNSTGASKPFEFDFSRSVTPALASCVRKRLTPVLKELLEHRRTVEYDVGTVIDLGTPPRASSLSARLMPLWRKATPHAPVSRSVRSLLPPDASFDADGCLSYRSTPGFADLFRQWLDRYAKPVDGDRHDLFLEVLHVSNEDLGGAWIDDVGSLVWLTAPGPSADDGTPDPRARLCRLRFEEGRAGPVTDAMEKAARCLADSPSAALVHPRFAFPPARYKRIVTLYRNAACALDGAGVVTCCGPGAHPFAPERRFTWIGASTTHLCAVETSGNAFCRDLESWAPEQIMGRYARYEIHGARRCFVDSSGAAECSTSKTTPARAPGVFVDIDARGGCALANDGALFCLRNDRFELANRDVIELAPCDAHVPLAVALLRDGRVVQVVDGIASPVPTVGAASTGASSLACNGLNIITIAQADGHLRAWPPTFMPPDLAGARLTKMSSEQAMTCGLTTSETIVCSARPGMWKPSEPVSPVGPPSR